MKMKGLALLKGSIDGSESKSISVPEVNTIDIVSSGVIAEVVGVEDIMIIQ
jgi:hypothetical protein